MVDVGLKPDQLRVARAEGLIRLRPDTIRLISQNLLKKGDVLAVAEIAGIQAAKATPTLIPLCHPIRLTQVSVKVSLRDDSAMAVSEVRCVGQTGVEMEALTAVTVALLTVYDMCKAVDQSMVIEYVKLVEKSKHDLPR